MATRSAFAKFGCASLTNDTRLAVATGYPDEMNTAIITCSALRFPLPVAALAALLAASPPAQSATAWDSPGGGNPVISGYFAGPWSCKFGDTYYLYVTPGLMSRSSRPRRCLDFDKLCNLKLRDTGTSAAKTRYSTRSSTTSARSTRSSSSPRICMVSGSTQPSPMMLVRARSSCTSIVGKIHPRVSHYRSLRGGAVTGIFSDYSTPMMGKTPESQTTNP
jgi:hypothetical protein